MSIQSDWLRSVHVTNGVRDHDADAELEQNEHTVGASSGRLKASLSHREQQWRRQYLQRVYEPTKLEEALLIYSNNTRYNLIDCCLPSRFCCNGTHTVLFVCENNFEVGIWPPALVPTG